MNVVPQILPKAWNIENTQKLFVQQMLFGYGMKWM